MRIPRSLVRAARALLVVCALAMGTGACAAIGLGGGGDTTLLVVNDLEERHTLEIFLNPATGPRRQIGTVQPGATATLRFDAPGTTERVQFMAEAEGEFALATQPIDVERGTTIRWNVRANEVVDVDPL